MPSSDKPLRLPAACLTAGTPEREDMLKARQEGGDAAERGIPKLEAGHCWHEKRRRSTVEKYQLGSDGSL